MAKCCYVCGKKSASGNRVSHSHNLSRRRWHPNLQAVKAVVDGSKKRIQVCATCLRSGKVLKAA